MNGARAMAGPDPLNAAMTRRLGEGERLAIGLGITAEAVVEKVSERLR